MTKDFAIVAYSNNPTSVQSDETFSAPMFGPAAASVSWTWRAACSPYVKHGPQQRRPPSSTVIQPSPSSSVERLANEFNQCLFIRYYTMRLELGLFPRVIRAGAGPHELGSGESRETTPPELTVWSDAEAMGGDEDSVGQWDPATNNPRSELDMVIRNVPYVRRFLHPSVSVLMFASRMKNATVGMPSQTMCSRLLPFPVSLLDHLTPSQKNSDAKSVLMHHKDLVGIRAVRINPSGIFQCSHLDRWEMRATSRIY